MAHSDLNVWSLLLVRSPIWLNLHISLKHSDWIDSSTSFRILDSTDLRWACPNAYSDFVAAVSFSFPAQQGAAPPRRARPGSAVHVYSQSKQYGLTMVQCGPISRHTLRIARPVTKVTRREKDPPKRILDSRTPRA
jgi:hypothetical protein